MLGIPEHPAAPIDDTAMIEYVDALAPHPAAWLSEDGASHCNEPFRQLLPDVQGAEYLGAWFFTEAAKQVVANWAEVADWMISDARFRLASDNHRFLDDMVRRLTDASPEFKARWDVTPIPCDPEPPVWQIVRSDGTVARVVMRSWWQAHRHGLLVQGVVQHG